MMQAHPTTHRPQRRERRATLIAMLALAWAAVALPARADVVEGNGKAAIEARPSTDFNAIALAGGVALELRQGSATAVVVHTDANLLPLLETVVEGEQLKVRWKRGTSVRTRAHTWVDVTAPQIRAVSSAGSGDITIDTMKVPRLALSVQGSGGVRAKALQNDDLTLSLAGSGAATLAGRAARASIDVSGSGGIQAADLKADDVRVSIAGSGDASVHAERTLTVSIAGSGNVTYSGDPTVQRAIAGSGSVRKR